MSVSGIRSVVPFEKGQRKDDVAAEYRKAGRALRTETTINDTRDFAIGRMLRNLPALRKIGFDANRRLLDVHRYRLTPAGLRIAIFFNRLYGRLLRPTLSALSPQAPPGTNGINAAFRQLEAQIDQAAAALRLAAIPAPADDATANAQKEQAIAELLVEKLGKDAESIRVTVVGDKTTLTGQVTLRATQELAEEVALYAGAKKIDNQITAKNEKGLFEGKVKKEMADNKIERAVRSKVKAEIGEHVKTITIECTEATCSVRGTLPDQARKALALKTAAGVEGVKNVVDLVTIKG